VKRRVIFVPDDYWTNPPKENTVTYNPEKVNAHDVRMAAALIIHHRASDTAGIHAVMSDPDLIERGSPLLWAILDLHRLYVSQTRTSVGIDALALYVQDIATVPENGTDSSRYATWACMIVDAHGRGDIAGMNAILDAARPGNRCTHVLGAVLDLYLHAIPELSSSAGRHWLDTCVTIALADEGTP
jgi:hypothetical protein